MSFGDGDLHKRVEELEQENELLRGALDAGLDVSAARKRELNRMEFEAKRLRRLVADMYREIDLRDHGGLDRRSSHYRMVAKDLGVEL